MLSGMARNPSEEEASIPTRRSFVMGALGAGGLGMLGSLRGQQAPVRREGPGRGWLPSRKYRACIIGKTGRGGYGHGLDLCFQSLPQVSVVAFSDPDPAGRAETAKKLGGARAHSDWEEMLRTEKPDLVAIGPRWVEERLEMARVAAAIGSHIYMEKPIARSLEEADAILEVTGRAGLKVAVAYHALLSPQVLHLKSLVENGTLGDLLEVRTRGKEDHRAGGEDLAVLGHHCLYLMRLFCGPPSWCTARVLVGGRDAVRSDAREASEPLGPVLGDTIHASYAFASGVQGHFASQALRSGPGGRFQCWVLGSKGCAVIPIGMDPQVHFLPDVLWSPAQSSVAWQPLPGAPAGADPSGLTGQDLANRRIVLDWLHAIENGGEPQASGAEGLAVLEMVQAVFAAQLSGARVPFPLGSRKHPLVGD